MNQEDVADYTKLERIHELYRRIRCNEMTSRKIEAEILGVSEATIKNYIQELRNVWEADIEYKNGKYVLMHEGKLGQLKSTYPLTACDAIIIMTTLMQAAPFMQTKINIIKSELMAILSDTDKKLFKAHFIEPNSNVGVDSNIGADNSSVEHNIRKLVEAISKGKLVSIAYISPGKVPSARTYIPVTLAYDQGKYYIIAKRCDKEGVLHLRIDRIKRIEILQENTSPINIAEMSQYLKKTWYMYTGSETKVEVRFKNNCKPVVKGRTINEGRMIEENDNDFIYEFICNGTAGIKIWLMGFGPDAEVIAPKELREEIRESVKEMIKIYEKSL